MNKISDNKVKDVVSETLAEMGLTVESVFIPFKQSRNANEKSPSLNWSATLMLNGKAVLTTNYSAGCGHCPSYKQGMKTQYDYQRVNIECQTGFKAANDHYPSKIQIKLDPKDFIYSVLVDAEAFEMDFEEWAGNFGYETDSRKAEKAYNECREIGVKLVRAIGTDEFARLQETFQGY